jgi:hypothetical protein
MLKIEPRCRLYLQNTLRQNRKGFMLRENIGFISVTVERFKYTGRIGQCFRCTVHMCKMCQE